MTRTIRAMLFGMVTLVVVGSVLYISSNYAHSDTDTIAYDNATSKASTTTLTNLLVSHTVGSGSNPYLLVGVIAYAPLSSATLDGTSMSLVGSTYETYNHMYVYLYYAANPDAGTRLIEIVADSASCISATVVSYTGVYGGAPEVWHTTQTGLVNPFTHTIATLTDNSWVAEMAVYPGGNSATPTTGSILRGEELTAGMFIDKGPITPAGDASLGIIGSNATYYGAVMVAFKPAIIATPTPTPTPVPYSTQLTVHKTANQSVVSNTTLQADAEMWLGLEGGKTYAIDGSIFATSTNATPDFKFGLTATSSPQMAVGYTATDGPGTGQGGGSSGGVITSSSGTGVVQVGTGGPMPIHLSGTITMLQNGTVHFEWAQNSSNSAAVTVMRGSYLRAEEVQ